MMTDASPIAPTGTKDQIEREALLPCPFCGGRPTLSIDDYSPRDSQKYRIECENPGCTDDVDPWVFECLDYTKLVAAWNRRAIHPAERREAALLANNDADRLALRKLNAERDALRADLAALKAAMVKPLVWNKGKANTPFGTYYCIEETNDEEPFWFVMFNGPTAQLGTFGDEASACDAAQADYAARILSALTIPPEEQEW